MVNSSVQSLSEAIESLRRDGETGYVAKADMAGLIALAGESGSRITNVEGFVWSETYHDLQGDLLWRYDIRLHRQHQPDADAVLSAVDFALRQLRALDTDPRVLHFKVFAETPPALHTPTAPPSAH